MRSPALTSVKVSFWLCLLFSPLPMFSLQPEDFPRGQIIDKVTCRANSQQSYALFLPSYYTPQKKWPILYAFDAGARGRLPLERFKEAAEKYGYIVAGSNNSRNGPLEPIAEAVRALIDDTQARFPIDERRVYLTGFSGGARVAVSVAHPLKGSVAGVIGCGAGFPSEITPSPSIPFVYFGTVGLEDFNYPEMSRLNQVLDRLTLPHRMATFEGGHDWPPPALCLEAIEWMELQAMKSGKRKMDEALIEEMFNRAVIRARTEESSNKVYEAFLDYRAIAEDFKGLRDVTPFEGKEARLRNSKEIKRALKKEKEQEESQNRLNGKLYDLKESYGRAENRSTVLEELSNEIAGLKRTAGNKERMADRLVARRVLSLFLLELSQDATQLFHTRNYGQASFNLLLAAQIKPEDPRLFYHLACAYSQDGKKKEAIGALKNAVEKGFADVLVLESDPDLEPLRKDPSYLEMVERLKKK
jgi:dienelactone hydrolase